MIIILAFDLLTKKVGPRNRTSRVTVVEYKVICHPNYDSFLKILLPGAPVSDDTPPSNDNFLVPYGLIKVIDKVIVKQKIIKLNDSFNYVAIISLFNIEQEIMLTELGQRCVNISLVTTMECTYLSTTTRKGLVITTNTNKYKLILTIFSTTQNSRIIQV